MTNGIFQKLSSPYEFNKKYAVIILLAVIVFVHSPSLMTMNLWIEDGISEKCQNHPAFGN